MRTFTYNDMTFTVAPCDDRWDLSYARPNGSSATVGTGLFAGLAEAEATARALALVKTIFPVGIKSVGPDVTHPNFIYWNKDSVSCPRQL